MKKVLKFSLVFMACGIIFTGCGKKDTTTDNDEEIIKLATTKLEDVLNSLYNGIKEEDLPMLETRKVEEEEIASYIGTDQINIKEIYVSEPMMGSIAHSVVLLRLNDVNDVNEAKQLIKDNANPRKWICVEAEKVIVDAKDDVIILIMSEEETANKIYDNFKKLK